ncbi:MAG TPA: hypothetical protein PKE34_03885, partial [Marmoricola sp.]|nr:hypothetical protein [Marmoricola sp.]
MNGPATLAQTLGQPRCLGLLYLHLNQTKVACRVMINPHIFDVDTDLGDFGEQTMKLAGMVGYGDKNGGTGQW